MGFASQYARNSPTASFSAVVFLTAVSASFESASNSPSSGGLSELSLHSPATVDLNMSVSSSAWSAPASAKS